MLSTLGDKVLPWTIKSNLLTLCPTSDLIALSSNDDQVQIFRMNGELVFAVPKKRPEAHVTQLRWKPNGRLLAIGYDDGVVILVNAHTGGIVHRLYNSDSEQSTVQRLGWGLSLSNPSAAKQQLEKGQEGITLDSLVKHGFQASILDLPPDLPAELTSLDVENLLPKISCLPAVSRDEDLFSSRTSIDSIFHGFKTEDRESTDALIVGFDDGQLQVNVYDTFSLGRLSQSQTDLTLALHTSHPYSSTQCLLWKGQGKGSTEKIFFQPIDIRPITDSGRYLSLIASKTTQLQNSLRYLNLAQQQITNEFKNSQDLPKKFMRNIEESLQEHDGCGFVQAAYHLATTGHCYDTMKEWLVDELAERGQKRWEKATTSGYENARQYTHENLLPALQRFTVLISRLRGLSKFQDSSVALGIDTQDLDQILETLSCLDLLGHCILISTNHELGQFHCFASWLRNEIDTQATDPLSAAAEEKLENDTVADYANILDYIQGAMLESQLYELLDVPLSNSKTTWDPSKEGSRLYARYKSEVIKLRNGDVLSTRPPGLQTLLGLLQQQCTNVFSKISAAQGLKIRLGKLIPLGEGIDHTDMIMLPSDHETASQQMDVYIAKAEKARVGFVTIHKISMNIVNGISGMIGERTASIKLPKGLQVEDIKFADPQNVVLLLSNKISSLILYVRYREAAVDAEGLEYSSTTTSIPSGALNDYSDAQALEGATKHAFPSTDHPWRPGRIEINGKPGRRVLCAVSMDQTRYSLFDLDSWQHEEDDGSNQMGDDET